MINLLQNYRIKYGTKYGNKVNKSLMATNRIVHLNVDAKTKSLLLFLIFKQLATKYNNYVFFQTFRLGFSSIRSIDFSKEQQHCFSTTSIMVNYCVKSSSNNLSNEHKNLCFQRNDTSKIVNFVILIHRNTNVYVFITEII